VAGSKRLVVDRELLAACRSGDPEAFAELVGRTQHQVFTLAFRLVGDRTEAEDVAQESYLRVYRSLGGFREDAKFETWLYRVVTNTAMTYLRRRGRFGDLLTESAEPVAAEPGPLLADRAVLRDEVRRALAELSPGLRAVLVLKEMYGLSCREIGEEMGITEGAVKVRLHRARKRLKDVIQGGTRHEV
jgi:RNA polymerase sigma-70 factor (ECF subfamily)